MPFNIGDYVIITISNRRHLEQKLGRIIDTDAGNRYAIAFDFPLTLAEADYADGKIQARWFTSDRFILSNVYNVKIINIITKSLYVVQYGDIHYFLKLGIPHALSMDDNIKVYGKVEKLCILKNEYYILYGKYKGE